MRIVGIYKTVPEIVSAVHDLRVAGVISTDLKVVAHDRYDLDQIEDMADLHNHQTSTKLSQEEHMNLWHEIKGIFKKKEAASTTHTDVLQASGLSKEDVDRANKAVEDHQFVLLVGDEADQHSERKAHDDSDNTNVFSGPNTLNERNDRLI
ncbi:MAG: general stress protein [Exiguobacterium oxidotolerans]|uniref:general stress protein n=1 Tax=unclassified Exiguobacterium TaxID=2644629 RepID=UPI001BE5E196|nr:MULTISPECIES: general stress protein [unclassified Exiguobacterium]